MVIFVTIMFPERWLLMHSRKKHLYLCALSLVFGLLFYVLFKPNSYLNAFAEKLLGIQLGMWLNCNVINHHFCDFLWGFSLTCGLIYILGSKPRPRLICTAITITYGTLWEVLQYSRVVPGTGDLLDMLTYLLASVLAAII